MIKKWLVLFFLFLGSSFQPFALHADTFFGNAPTGLLKLEDMRYPVYLYVPQSYKPTVSYPLVIAVPDFKDNPEKFVAEWSKLAKKRNLIVLVPSLLVKSGESPQNYDAWLFKVKKAIAERYNISKSKIFLIGKGAGADYSAYLGIQYPEEFSAVALLNGSWVSPYEGLMLLKSRPRKQLPFYAVLTESDPELYKRTEEFAYKLTKKGYPVFFEKVKEETEMWAEPFQLKLMSWLEEQSQVWARTIQGNQKNWKEKTHKHLEEFFTSK